MTRLDLSLPTSKLTRTGAVIVALVVLVGAFAPLISPYNPQAISGPALAHPSLSHLLGTNNIGQDIFSQLIWGTRTSLLVGVGGAGATVLLGVVLGMGAGLLGGWVDVVTMRAVDILLAIPVLPTLILIAALAGPGIWVLVVAIGFLGGPRTARILRSQVLSLRQRGFINASRGFGGGPFYVVRRHLVPGVAPLMSAGFANWAGLAISLQAGLAFLGLGNPFQVSWGEIIQQALALPGWEFGFSWVWWALPAGIALMVAVLGFAFLGADAGARAGPAADPDRRRSARAKPDLEARPEQPGGRTPFPPIASTTT
jgi:peptide/nickel transport system permease protein